jgi:predicted Ser/Thr protein kinase
MLDYAKIDDVEIENINYNDYPDFSDAYVMKAMYNDPKTGEYRELTEDELENLDGDWVHEQVNDWIH